jgi:apolipoprotein N-acyltransferase
MIRLRTAPLLIAIATAGYWLAFATTHGAPAVLPAIACVILLARLPTSRQAFYAGLAAGVAMYTPHLFFFKSVFGATGMLLWLVAGFPVGIFVFLVHHAHQRLGATWALCLTPVLWTGIEYFRSELYYLKFAWLLPGQVVAFAPGVRLAWIGAYGLGFILAVAAALIADRRVWLRTSGLAIAASAAISMYIPAAPAEPSPTPNALHIAGVQTESPDEAVAAISLEQLAIAHPEAQILVMSEYTFLGPVPESVRDVLRRYHRYLVVGGIRGVDIEKGQFHDTAFVIGPDGKDVFYQDKSVPVQFMGDGLPATERRVWLSPWGKIGIAVCYDLSYARVMDDFVRQGAQGLIVPTMDLTRWGEYERRMLHGRVAPIRSAEYGIPTFGVWSSGVSQLTDGNGRVIATAQYPGQGDMIAGPFDLRGAGRIPPDRPLAMASSAATGVFVLYLIVWKLRSIRGGRSCRSGYRELETTSQSTAGRAT